MILLLHPGAMGAAVGTCLVGAGHEVGWVSAGRSQASASRATDAGLAGFDSLAAGLAGADVVLSICPPHGAFDVATAVADLGFAGTYVDANAVSPKLAGHIGDAVTAGGARYVDGGIIGPPPTEAGSTRLYLAGDDGTVAALFTGTALETVDVGGPSPAASAVKMTYAAWTKGTSALLVSARRTAEALGVDADLTGEWARSQPQLPEQWARASEAATEKGWRWAFELAEVGRTFAAAGEPEGFGAAASRVFGRATAPDRSAVAAALDPLDPRALGMAPHPEGGWYREVHRATTTVETPHGTRATATTVSFLLEPGQVSAWHRVRSDELWLWQGGGPVRVTVGGSGDRPDPGEAVELAVGGSHLVPGGVWQTAEPVDGTMLVACVVTPGFDFDDFELA